MTTDTTPEAVERLARECHALALDWAFQSMGFVAGGARDTLRALAAENADLNERLLMVSQREAATQARHDAKTAALEAERDALRAKVDRLRGAITPSGDTKAAYMGEVKDPETKRYVSWTAIKMIMAMIAARAALDASK